MGIEELTIQEMADHYTKEITRLLTIVTQQSVTITLLSQLVCEDDPSKTQRLQNAMKGLIDGLPDKDAPDLVYRSVLDNLSGQDATSQEQPRASHLQVVRPNLLE